MGYNFESDAWFVCHIPNALARLRLFCFPYAGGGPSTYCSWSRDLPSDIEIIGVKMPGLEGRPVDATVSSVPSLVQALTEAISKELSKPFAFFGHSLGAFIGFELGRELRKHYQCEPVHFFASGIRAPQIPPSNPPINHLPDSAFVQELDRRYNCIPEEILESPDILEQLLPGLRASFRIYESYRYSNGGPLECPITVFGGLQDDTVNHADLEAWRFQTKRTFSLHMIPGKHLFILFERERFLRTFSDQIQKVLAELR
jgi:medium-chain acyl-[acyl-carrier-protein] hydrolase